MPPVWITLQSTLEPLVRTAISKVEKEAMRWAVSAFEKQGVDIVRPCLPTRMFIPPTCAMSDLPEIQVRWIDVNQAANHTHCPPGTPGQMGS